MNKKPSPSSDTVSKKEFERFKEFTKRLVSVPKKDIDEQAEKYARQKEKARKDRNANREAI